MKKLITLFTLVAVVLAASAVTQGGIEPGLSYVVTPADLADGPTFLNGQGGEMFGFDPDSVKPTGSFTKVGAPGFANSSFWSNVQGSAIGGGADYTSFRMSPKDIFGITDVTIGELAEISYWTNWESDRDWQLKIYTESDDKWYKHRFQFTPPSFGDNDWNLSSTNDNLTVSDIFDKEANSGVAVPGTGLLSDLNDPYGTEKILFIDIVSSYMTNSPPGDSYLDGVVMTLTDDSTATMNLEAVPEPASIIVWGLLGAGCAGGAMARRRKRRASWSDETQNDIHNIIDRGRTSV